jgi:hypothetical protein
VPIIVSDNIRRSGVGVEQARVLLGSHPLTKIFINPGWHHVQVPGWWLQPFNSM